MKTKQISENGYQLTRLGLFHCYLVRERDGFTLIDTCLSGSADDILRSAATLGGEVLRIVLTHAHGDHIGSLDDLTRQLPKPDIAISTRDARLLAKKPAQDRSLDPGEAQCPVKGSFPGASTQPTHLLTGNELFGSLRCLATPGHTPGHFSFLDERDGTLYAGDALITVGGHAHVSGWAPWYFPLPNFATWHRPTAVSSVRTLADLPIVHIAPGHGRVILNRNAIADALREAQA